MATMFSATGARVADADGVGETVTVGDLVADTVMDDVYDLVAETECEGVVLLVKLSEADGDGKVLVTAGTVNDNVGTPVCPLKLDPKHHNDVSVVFTIMHR
jgi:hypothetical protein